MMLANNIISGDSSLRCFQVGTIKYCYNNMFMLTLLTVTMNQNMTLRTIKCQYNIKVPV